MSSRLRARPLEVRKSRNTLNSCGVTSTGRPPRAAEAVRAGVGEDAVVSVLAQVEPRAEGDGAVVLDDQDSRHVPAIICQGHDPSPAKPAPTACSCLRPPPVAGEAGSSNFGRQ